MSRTATGNGADWVWIHGHEQAFRRYETGEYRADRVQPDAPPDVHDWILSNRTAPPVRLSESCHVAQQEQPMVPTPEPGTAVLLCAGLIALALMRRKR